LYVLTYPIRYIIIVIIIIITRFLWHIPIVHNVIEMYLGIKRSVEKIDKIRKKYNKFKKVNSFLHIRKCIQNLNRLKSYYITTIANNF